MAVPLENQTAMPNLQTEPFMTNNLIAAPGAGGPGSDGGCIIETRKSLLLQPR